MEKKYKCPRCGSPKTQYNNILRTTHCLDCNASWVESDNHLTHVTCGYNLCDYWQDGVCTSDKITLKVDAYGKIVCDTQIDTGIND